MADAATFEFYFQKADLDRDGKISGMEAIQFFKGTNLPQPILAKIWHAADNGQTGSLSRQEFYNALKLVTVAQSGRELTPEIIKAALVGPASLKIPAPKIQLPQQQAIQQTAPRGSFPSPQAPAAPVQQAPALQQQQTPRAASFSNSQPFQAPLQQTQTSRAPAPPVQQQQQQQQQLQQQPSRGSFSNPLAGYQPQVPFYQGQQRPVQQPGTSGYGSGIDPRRNAAGGFDSWPPARPSIQGQLFTSVPTRPAVENQSFPSQQNAPATSRASLPSAADIPFGTGAFSDSNVGPVAPQAKTFGSDLVPVPLAPVTAPPVAGKELTAQPAATQAGPANLSMGGVGQQRPIMNSAAWPKMTQSDVQRYSRIFVEVDTDKDGKISGAQARDLFLSWRLPRDVLKQVWDLSDQDGDSMLSFREFCTALYMMDRFKEGRPLPPALPAGFHFLDATATPSVAAARLAEAQAALAQHNAGYNLPSWQQNPRVLQAVGPGIPPRFMSPHMQGAPQMVSRPVVNQAAAADDKLAAESKVLDSKEKLEFYRNKLQEIVLFKRKCDNRIAEVTDRASAEKREEEAMSKKYEEKYKQALEINSRLVSEEATARELHARRGELHNAISEIDRGGNPNVLLQTRADRISNDLDELEKALAQRGQLLGFEVKGAAPVELPFGWQPGLQENAVEWDENWDKFDDEGYTVIQDVIDGPAAPQGVGGPATFGWDEENIFADSPRSEKALDEPPAAESPRADSEVSSLKSGVNSPRQDLWSPKSPAVRSPPSASRLSADFHENDSFNSRPSFASNDGFDQGPSFDSGDHAEEKPWASVFNDQDDVRASWGLQNDYTASQDLDIGSLRISTASSGRASEGWNESSGDFFGTSSSVPSTPLFKVETNSGNFFGDDSRLNSFASTRSSAVFDETDPFRDTGPFGTKSSDRWSTF